MEVLILSKTKYGPTQFCVGGICLENNQFIRLLRPGGYYQPADTPFEVGDIWDITFTINDYRKEPHNEDTTVHSQKFVRKVYKLETFIKNSGVNIWRDHITNIYEGKILWTNWGKGYFSENYKNYPKNSVGFWISNVDLIYNSNYQEYTYTSNGKKYAIKFKGNVAPIPVIPKGKLIRLSLAKWWKPEDSDIEERCYLQLSGWYDDLPEPVVSRPVKPNPVASKPVTPNPVTSKPVTPNPVTSKPVTPNPVASKPVTPNPVTSKLVTPNPIASKPVTPNPVASKRVTPNPVASKPVTPNPVTSKPVTPNPVTSKPVTPNDSNTSLSTIKSLNSKDKNTSGSCYIATLCYEDYYADEVCRYREFRDNTLKKFGIGRLFVKKYYEYAPKITMKLENKHLINKSIKRFVLNPLLKVIIFFKL